MKIYIALFLIVLTARGFGEITFGPSSDEGTIDGLFPTRYFVFASGVSSAKNLSYIVPISDSADIEHARLIYRNWNRNTEPSPQMERAISMAKVSSFHDGINRNYLLSDAPEWSWRVSEFLGFVYGTYEVFDGSPQSVEDNIVGWMHVGAIGFWGFHPIGELPLQPDIVVKNSYWKWSMAFGRFNDEHYPWIETDGIGWIYVSGFDPFNLWLYSRLMGSWVWTSETTYPNVWRADDETWIELKPRLDTTDLLTGYNFKSKERETFDK